MNTKVLKTKRRNIHRPRVHTEIVKHLLKDLQSGVYVEGQELPPERALMEEFGVGRPAVRESLAALGRMGLVDLCPGMRAKVCKPTMKPLLSEMKVALQIYSSSADGWRQLQNVRMLFEVAVVRELAHIITETQLATLKQILKEQHGHLKKADYKAFADADIRFHFLLVEFLANPFLGLLAESFAEWLITPLFTSVKVCNQGECFCAAHLNILDALAQRNSDEAERAMREHLKTAHAIYQSDPAANIPPNLSWNLSSLPEEKSE